MTKYATLLECLNKTWYLEHAFKLEKVFIIPSYYFQARYLIHDFSDEFVCVNNNCHRKQ